MREFKFPYWGPLVLEGQVEPEFVDILLEKGNESRAKNLDHRKHLAGMIDNEYHYEDYNDWFIPQFTSYIKVYIELLESTWLCKVQNIKDFRITSMWINYQKANEYQPPHTHSQDLSFVIYLKVPAKIKKEHEKTKGQRSNPGPGAIHFEYGIEILPFSISGFSKLPEVGDLFIFPAWLTHHVHAFKSNVERISVSGNIKFKDDKI